MPIRLMAFDLDGTLIRGRKSLTVIGAALSHPEWTDQMEILKMRGQSSEEMSDRVTPWMEFSKDELCCQLVHSHLAPGVDEAFRLLHARHVTTAIVSIRWDFIVQWFAKRLDMVQAGAQWCSIAIWPKQRDLFVKACPFRAESPGACARLPRRERRAPTACSSI